MAKQVYEQVTATLIEQLEQGVAPWVKPWRANGQGSQFPHNATTEREYNGVNVIILAMQQVAAGYAHAAWATYKQIQNAGGQVRKGEKAATIVYFDRINVQDRKNPDEQKVIPMLKSFSVFNVEQADWGANGIPGALPADAEPVAAPDFAAACDATIAATGASIAHGGNVACYIPALDAIRLPERASFRTSDDYYGTAFHELTHWSGAESRLDRELSGRFGNPEYAFEELVAELGSAFLCARHGVDGHLQHAEYLSNWLAVLKADSGAIFKAASLAQKAANYIAPQVDATEQPVALAA